MIRAYVDGKRYGCPASLILTRATDPHALTLLKRFRDEVLSRSALGRAIIDLYYFWGPAISDILQENDLLRKGATGILRGILPVVEKILTFSNAPVS